MLWIAVVMFQNQVHSFFDLNCTNRVCDLMQLASRLVHNEMHLGEKELAEMSMGPLK